MTEPVSLGFAVVSLSFQLFAGCVKGEFAWSERFTVEARLIFFWSRISAFVGRPRHAGEIPISTSTPEDGAMQTARLGPCRSAKRTERQVGDGQCQPGAPGGRPRPAVAFADQVRQIRRKAEAAAEALAL